MSQYTLYKLYKKQRRLSGSTDSWEDVYPQVFSYDGGGTMTPVIVEEDSPSCGYVPPVTPQYRWVDMDISTNYYCEGTTKYYKQKRQISLDSGTTWNDMSPMEYQRGASAETASTDCGAIEPIYEWRNITPTIYPDTYICDDCSAIYRTTSGTPYCSGASGYDKYVDVYSQVSYDGGTTWETTATTPTLVEANSEDCGYTPATMAITYYSPSKLNVTLSAFTPDATAETFSNGVGKIEFAESVTAIGQSAFEGKTALTNVEIPNTVTSIDDWAFHRCSGLTSINIPNSVTSIGIYAFDDCSGLTSINIPDSVTTIGESVFGRCTSLTRITIPDSVTSIGDWAFEDCTSLSRLNSDVNGVANIPSGVTSIGNWAFYRCSGLTSINIPNGVTSIGGVTFAECSGLTSVSIGSGVTSIGRLAFADCTSLTSVDIPNSVTSIGQGVFERCSSLTSIDIPNSVTSIGNIAFYGTPWYRSYSADTSNIYDNVVYINDVAYQCVTTSITSHTFKSGTKGIGCAAFAYCTGLTSIDIPDCVTSIGYETFSYCSGLTSVTIPDSVTSIGRSAFEDCRRLSSITIPNSVTSIGQSAFNDCKSLSSVTIPDSVTSIGDGAFAWCYGLTSINIPSGVTSISREAFQGCRSLTSITIPNSVTSIGESAFTACSGLTSVTVNATTPPTLGTSVFYITNNSPIYVPSASVDAYKTAENWSTYADRIFAIP